MILCLSIWFANFFIFDRSFSIYKNSMSFSGFLTIIFGLAYSVIIDRSKLAVIQRWRDLWILEFDCAKLENIILHLDRREIFATITITSLLVGATYIGYEIFYHMNLTQFHVVSLICAALVGLRISRLAAHGLIGSVLQAQDVGLNLIVDHSDRAGGTAEIGKFYLFNASVLLIPAVWLVIWIVNIPLIEDHPGKNNLWPAHFVILLAITSAIFVVAVWLPMIKFSQMMHEWKGLHLVPELASLKRQYFEICDGNASALGPAEGKSRQELVRRMHALTSISDWPVTPDSIGKHLSILSILLPPIVSGLLSYSG